VVYSAGESEAVESATFKMTPVDVSKTAISSILNEESITPTLETIIDQ
jgi:hypothetical protein